MTLAESTTSKRMPGVAGIIGAITAGLAAKEESDTVKFKYLQAASLQVLSHIIPSSQQVLLISSIN